MWARFKLRLVDGQGVKKEKSHGVGDCVRERGSRSPVTAAIQKSLDSDTSLAGVAISTRGSSGTLSPRNCSGEVSCSGRLDTASMESYDEALGIGESEKGYLGVFWEPRRVFWVYASLDERACLEYASVLGYN